MSELTQCNHCSLEAIKARAKHDKKKVTIMPGVAYKSLPPGFDVYVHPRNVEVRMFGKENRKRWWVCWFMEISDHCVC